MHDMTDPKPASTLSFRKNAWGNIAFLASTFLVGTFGTAWYLLYHAITAFDIGLLIFFFFATGMSITVGYHRLFAHATFKASPIVRFLVLFFGAGAFEQSALKWASQHRDHHAYVDTDRDPYNIQNGFWYAHIGWLMFRKRKCTFENVKDLQKSQLILNQHKYYTLWAVVAGIITPTLFGAFYGHALSGFLIGFCLRLTLVYHSTFLINSLCHMYGSATYDPYSTAKDNWLAALVTNGEGYHNFHHRFPSDYRNGVRWYHWDPSKWSIALLEKIGLVWEVKRISKFRIMEARLAGENEHAKTHAETFGERAEHFRENLKNHHDKLKQHLIEWEQQAKAYQEALQLQIAHHSEAFRLSALKKMLDAREKFEESREKWRTLVRSPAQSSLEASQVQQ
jgi:stearoyl-CoA desaturase (Delta-9 desaturase)